MEFEGLGVEFEVGEGVDFVAGGSEGGDDDDDDDEEDLSSGLLEDGFEDEESSEGISRFEMSSPSSAKRAIVFPTATSFAPS